MTNAGRTIALVTLLLCLSLTAIGGGVATPTDDSVAFQQDTPQTENETNDTVRHQNPDEYGEDSDEEELERWLSGQLSGQLEGGAIELSEGEYDRASEFIDEEYRDRLDQYVEVAGDTDGDSQEDDFEEAQREQERLTDSVAEYNETKTDYEEARDEGDEERARELARDLEELADETGDSSQHTQNYYDNISDGTDFDSSDADASVEAVNEDVQTQQADVREQEFAETELTVEPAAEEVSFTNPLVASGELQTADGTPVANEEIRLDVGNQTIQTETDSAGTFDFEYRPVSVPLSADSVSVQYVPENQSTNLGSETSVPVSIEQVEPSLTAPETEPETVAYGDEVTVQSELAVDGTPVDNASLDVSVGGESLGVAPTEAGAFGGTTTIPADVPAGEQELRVALPFEDRALASTEAETTITVEETEPDLSVAASQTGDHEVAVDGALEVADEGIEDESVEFVVDGTVLETMTTDEDGAFGGVVVLPEETAAGDVQLVAVHDDDGTNLARTEAATTVSFPTSTESLLPTWAWLALGVLAVVAGVAGVRRYREPTSSAPVPVSRDEGEAPTPTSDSPTPSVSGVLLSRASEHLSSGDPDEAVQSCYVAVRQRLGSELRDSGSLTHWEFYVRYQDGESDAARSTDQLRTVTEGYERAVFGPTGVSEREAATILERARQLCGFDESAGSGPADD